MNKSSFAELIQEEMGLDIGVDDLTVGFDELPEWDSVHLLSMIVLLEKRVARPLSLPDFLGAQNLETIYELVRG